MNLPKSSFFLFGPRGTGKSTWLKAVFPDAEFIDFLSQDQYRFYLARPDRLRGVVEGTPDCRTYVVDEVQRIPEILSVVHLLIEAHPDKQFILTGSSARKLKRAGIDLLGGRALLKRSHSFLAAELGASFCLDKALTLGLVPLVLAAEDPQAVLNAYVLLYLREEVQAEGLVRNVGAFARFLEAISFSHGSLLNVAEVARECEVSRKTVEGYVGIVRDLLIASLLPVFSKRAKRKLIKHEKFYFFDSGVYRSIRPKGPLDRPAEIDGAALEGLVYQHLRAWNDYSGAHHELFFWRTRSGVEVDFVVYGEDTFTALEVKNTARPGPADLRTLRAFGQDYPEAARMLLYRGDRRMLIDGVLCMPCEHFLASLRPGHDLVPDVSRGAHRAPACPRWTIRPALSPEAATSRSTHGRGRRCSGPWPRAGTSPLNRRRQCPRNRPPASSAGRPPARPSPRAHSAAR